MDEPVPQEPSPQAARWGGAHISGSLGKLTPGLNSKRERELSGRGNWGEGERKRTFQVVLNKLRT